MRYEKTVVVNSDDFKEIERTWELPEMIMYFPVRFEDSMVMNIGLICGYYMSYSISDKFACLCEKTCEKHGKDAYAVHAVSTEQYDMNTADFSSIYGRYEFAYNDNVYALNVINGRRESDLVYRYTYEDPDNHDFGSDYLKECLLESDTKREQKKAQTEEKAFFEDRTWMPKEDGLTFGMENLLKNINL